MTKNSGVKSPLRKRLLRDCRLQSLRYERLTGSIKGIATEGIKEHFQRCDKAGIPPDPGAIKEVIDNAIKGKKTYTRGTEKFGHGEEIRAFNSTAQQCVSGFAGSTGWHKRARASHG